MPIVAVVPSDPPCERLFEPDRAGPFPKPEQFFIERPHEAFRFRVALGVVVAGEGLPDAQGATGLHMRLFLEAKSLPQAQITEAHARGFDGQPPLCALTLALPVDRSWQQTGER